LAIVLQITGDNAGNLRKSGEPSALHGERMSSWKAIAPNENVTFREV
jgi:hypothetical protein